MIHAEKLEWLKAPIPSPDSDVRRAAEARQAVLTKPPGSLGRLEEVAVTLAAMQGTARPRADKVHICVFAADHGVAAEGVSAFPQSVTAEMIKNFARGGAAVSVAARELGAVLEIINLGTAHETGALSGVINQSLGPHTDNLAQRPAMTPQQLTTALEMGRRAALRAAGAGCRIFIGGEMGIGNSTSAAALACALLEMPPAHIAGPGTGLDEEGVVRKIKVIERALQLHCAEIDSPLEALRRLGGFEIAALAGAYIACAQARLPVLVDGFIAGSAALCAAGFCPGVTDWLIFSHVSAEPGHRAMLDALGACPLIDLGLRLGEGSGAAVAVPLLRLACALHNDMATFAEAGVSGKS